MIMKSALTIILAVASPIAVAAEPTNFRRRMGVSSDEETVVAVKFDADESMSVAIETSQIIDESQVFIIKPNSGEPNGSKKSTFDIGHTGSEPGTRSKSGKSMGTCTFNNERLHGTFSLFSTSGDTASVAVVGFDGEGTLIPIEDLTGDFPDGNGGRMPAAASINNGSYEVGPNGRGQITMSLGPAGNPFFDGTVFEFVASQTGTDGEITELSTFIVGGGFGGQLVAPTLKKICD